MKKILLSVLLFTAIGLTVTAQWSDDPLVNTIVNNLAGSQAVPHIAYDDDGNFYVGFYSNDAGNYDIRLHYYTFDGVAQWANDGLLVSGHAQNSWVTEWDLTTDNIGNCVMAFNDVRDGNANVYAYAISSTGSFLWGADGINLTTDSQDEFVPSITVTSDNNAIVAWSRPTSTQNEIVMQKITPAGALSWGATGITYQTGSQSYTGARVLGIDGDNYLMAFYKETGTFPGLTRHIYVQKFDGSGSSVWAADVLASNSNGINSINNFYIASDNADGIVISWTDDWDSDMNIDGKAQRVLSDGTIDWPANGVEVTTAGSTSNQNVRILGVDNSGNVLVTWSKKNANQSQTAIAGQKINSSGVRQWTDMGIEFVAMSADVTGSDGGAVYDGTNAIIIFEEWDSGSAVNSHVKALAVDGSGTLVWSPTSTLMASRSTSKIHLAVSGIYNDQVIAVWEEAGTDIYMQNIYTDGSLGDPPISDDATLSDLTVNGNTIDGFSPNISFYTVAIPSGDPLPITGATTSFPAATINITQTTAVPGQSTVLVTAEDDITQITYTIDFYVANTDATLSDLTIDGVTVPGFAANIFVYDYQVPQGDPIPVVGATTTDPNATANITQATELPGVANVLVTAEDGTATNTYTVNFLYDPNTDATLIDLLVDNQSIPNFDPDILNYTYGVVFENPPPFVDGIPNDPLATIDMTQATEVPGDALIDVTAEDGVTSLTYVVSFYYLDYDAHLSDLTVDGLTIQGFDPNTINYQYFVDDALIIPVVDGTTSDPDASLTVTQATIIPGEATLYVLAEDGVAEMTYIVHFFTSNSDATLADLSVDGETIEGFDPLVTYYEVNVNEGQTIPVIDGVPNDALATQVVTQAVEIPGDGTIVVTAEDGSTQITYTVHFNLITGISNDILDQISIFPNPVNNEFQFSGLDGDVEIEIVSLLGKTVFQGKVSDNRIVNVQDLEEGIYFAIIRQKSGELNTLKFIKK